MIQHRVSFLTVATCAILSLALASTAAADEVPTKGLRLHLKADSLAGAVNGTGVGQWRDSGPNGHDATQPTPERQPVYVEKAIGDKPGLKFDGKDDTLTVAGMPLKDLPVFELFIVAKTGDTDTQSRALLSATEGSKAFMVSCRSNYFFQVYDRDAKGLSIGSDARAAVGTPYIVDIIHDAPGRQSAAKSSIMDQWKSGASANYLPDTAVQGPLLIGGKDATDITVSEILIYDHRLTEAERSGVEKALADKYGLKVTPMESLPTPLTAGLPGDCVTTLGLSYPLPKATLLPAKGTEQKKALHGKNQFVHDGVAEVTPDGLLLKGTEKPTWVSPYLWSGLKDVQVTARLKLDAPPAKGVFGLKFGHTWAIVAQGPRLAFSEGKAAFPAAGAAGAVDVAVPVGEWFTVKGWYSFDDGVFEAALNDKPILKVTMPAEPFEDFMKTFGRPAPLAGIGVFAEGCDVRVGEFSFLAGAPRRRVVVIGDSISQQAYWVLELDKALGEKVTNLGIGGDSAKMMALRFDRDVLPLKPEICIIFGGTNDIGWGSSAGAVQSALAQMAAKAKASGIKPVLCEILPRRGMAQKVPLYNDEIRKLAAAQSIPLIAWHDAMLDPAKGEMKEGYAPDGTHTARLGGQAMVKAIDLKLLAK